ncbi:MAG TPA: protein translocase subunit SecD [Gemmatimonadaceae bacterium]|nr:protein translocase subunit SecD [Gemmatimonadaceae bacterium]
MSTITKRLIAIGLLTLGSLFAIWPRTITERTRQGGRFVEKKVFRVPIKYGLDLQGGMHIALEVDESKQAVADKSEAIDRALKVVRTRIDEFGTTEPVVQKVGNDRIIVELPGIDDQERAEAIVQRSAFLQFQIVDESGALERVLPRIDAIVRQQLASGNVRAAPTAGAAEPEAPAAITSLLKPADSSAAAGRDSTRADTAAAAEDTGLLAGARNGPFSRLLQPGGIPGEYIVDSVQVPVVQSYLALPDVQAALPPGKVLRWGSKSLASGGRALIPLYVLDARPIITGEHLNGANPATDPVDGNVVQFTLDNQGGRRFGMETAKHVGDYMAIVLDDRVMGQPPVIQTAITTRGQITMRGQPLQAAQDLALVLRAGSLPVPLKVVQMRSIGPSLGEDAVHRGIWAGVIAVALVVAIMVIYYRFAGLLAVAGLVLYALFTLGALAGFDAVLTLPGLAGFVLSIGIAVDANVLIFERIREELDRGRAVRPAVDAGFKHALSAIIDSNVTTALTAMVLYWFGTGPVRGFAVTLLAGTAASMISAIFVVRTFFLMWLNRVPRGAQTLSI